MSGMLSSGMAERRDENAHLRGLELIRARAKGQAEGVWGPDSALWNVCREPAVVLCGQRAVLLQLAHPAIAAAGVQASDFRKDFVGRTFRTFKKNFTLVYGDLPTALAVADRVHAQHAAVRGTIGRDTSERANGRPFAGTDSRLAAWVLATMIESSVHAFDVLMEPLPPTVREDFYQDMRLFGALFGVLPEHLPSDWPGFRRWFDDVLAGDTLEVGGTAKELAGFLFEDGWNVWGLDRVFAAGVMPPRWREAFGLSWSPAVRASFEVTRRTLGTALRVTPARLRWLPAWHQAMRRVALAHGTRPSRLGGAVALVARRVPLPLAL
jgi:uncharacterized protein (DUF2236 family)